VNGSFSQWVPTFIAVASVIGTAFVANSTINRHERDIETLRDKVQELETSVAVLRAMCGRKGGEPRDG